MNKIIIMSLFLFSSIFLCNLLESGAHKKIHDNNIIFYGYVDSHPLNFKITNHCISRKQPYDNTVETTSRLRRLKDTKTDGVIRGLNIKAGRHGSSEVANCLRYQLLDGYSIFNKLTFALRPIKLNFAVIGTLSINGKYFDDIILAQGNTLLHNNWWFGGRQCVIYSKPNKVFNSVTCTARDNTKWCFTHGYIGKSKKRKHTGVNAVRVDIEDCSKTIK